MSVYGSPFTVLTNIGGIDIDVSLNEEHEYPTYITQNPVEDGTVYADHQILLPVVFNFIGRITDASIAFLGIPKLSRSHDAFLALVALEKAKKPFTLITGLATYENMLIENIRFLRQASDGQSVRFSAVIREIQVIGADATTNRDRIAPDVSHSALPPVDRGFVTKVVQ